MGWQVMDMSDSNEMKQYKYYPLLVAISTTCMITSLILIYRLVQVGVFTEPGGVFLFPMSFLLGDVIAEVYGYESARRQVWYITTCLILFTLTVTIVVNLPAPHTKLDLSATCFSCYYFSVLKDWNYLTLVT